MAAQLHELGLGGEARLKKIINILLDCPRGGEKIEIGGRKLGEQLRQQHAIAVGHLASKSKSVEK